MTRRVFEGRTVVVTGGAGGLGAALCDRFLLAGARVAAIDLDEAALAALENRSGQSSERFAVRCVDLTDESATAAAIASVEAELGLIYCLVNNAGVTHLKNFASDEAPAIARVMAINFQGAVHATAACFDSLVANSGLVIGISSVAGYAPLVARTGYVASKHALEGFLKTLRSELRGTGVGVLIVRPSFIATGLRAEYEPDSEDEKKQQSVGQQDSPEDVADQIFRAAERNARRLATGRVGAFSYWMNRVSTRVFEWLMLRNIRPE